ncbi:YecA family protein [Lysobacter sp. TY2-98]|uniref:UPF0149 family protein n=1 Tax=Lysobacter sp. TY2-98 TaxID=2290922 RepID=UPI000E1FCE5B|nr:UPF0149 family protein [Lysobacter sp. TY2-98]AXK73242.1 YecA family protein [Lysobacter sp. TY2-98]
MKVAPPLSDAQIERLSELLDQRAVPFKGFNLEALDGYLTALALSPEAVTFEEWETPVWGSTPRWADEDEARDVRALLATHAATAEQRVRYGDDDLPDTYAPLLWLPENLDEHEDDELDVGRDWAMGFFRAVELREAAWEKWLDENDWIEEIFDLLDRLASGEVVAEDPTQPGTPIAYKERLEIIGSLPGMLNDLHHHRIEALTPREPIRRAETPERNAPCPCGSGKKYKKCCGASSGA